MMSEIKRGLKLLKYGYGFKTYVALGIVVFLGGMLLTLPVMLFGYFWKDVFWGNSLVFGILVMAMAPQMLMQISYSFLLFGVPLASAKRRMLDIAYTDFLTIVSAILGYVILVVVTGINIVNFPQQTDIAMEVMLISAIMFISLLLYDGVAYKYYLFTTLGFVVGIVVGGDVIFEISNRVELKMDFLSECLICLVLVAAGTLLSCWLRRCLYKKPVSPMAAGASLRKALR